ncbi:TonB-dependent receptor [Sphingomonas ginsenosidivorax]|uniref:TonB-dependent receptor n=1 Tax=Sphingomonas ginsenosidivorax TaxID=862135 RepID=A0A5C6UGC7_9SPHN|nr:TonB-dependent receptor [Sphingomonas ginsenosidivorax]TXC70998.1 TonB-dependent receptor [Sphingomonas ginsenosidivorax]
MDRGSSISFVRCCRYALVASAAWCIWAPPTRAEKARPGLTIPAGTLRSALDAVARQSGISIGMAGSLPDLRIRRIDRARDVADALRRILSGSRLRAVRVDATTWRIEPLPAKPMRTPTRRQQAVAEVDPGDIIVTAGKRDERLSDLPASISIVGGQALARLAGRRGLVDLMATTDSAFSTNLGPGRDRIFLRGVADSAFNGTSQSLVSLYLDEARIGYAAPDPDLRLVDVERVEVLRGPQGTLYGTGALGGVVRIVTAAPDLDRFAAAGAVEATGITNGAFGGATEGTLNVPIKTGSLALRASGWSETMPGWIDDTGRNRRDVNRIRRIGGRSAVRWAIGDWHATLAGVLQRINARDSHYATSGLSRATRIAEPQDNDFTAGTLTVGGAIGKLDAQATTAFVAQEFGSTYDASVVASTLGLPAPLAYVEARSAQFVSQEVRVSDPTARHPWIVGATVLHSTSRLNGRFVSTADGGSIAARRDEEDVTEAALFAEGTQRLTRTLDFKLGLRAFSTLSHLEQRGPDRERAQRLGVTPSGTLTWHRDDIGLIWLRYASAVRPAGVSRTAVVADRRIPGDELQSVELGWRVRAPGARLDLHGAVFGSVWEHLRSDTVGRDGLLGTIDAGNAANYGIEVGGRFDLAPVMIDFGTTLQRARLRSRPAAVDDDRRLPVVPDISARLGATRRFAVRGRPAQVFAAARYTGRTRLSFDPLLDRPAGRYATIDTGASIDTGARRWSIDVTNLLDGRGNSFGFGNPFTLETTTQTVPVRPRTVTLRLAIGL